MRESREELFTINRLWLSPPLHRELGNTNIIKIPILPRAARPLGRPADVTAKWSIVRVVAPFLDAEKQAMPLYEFMRRIPSVIRNLIVSLWFESI